MSVLDNDLFLRALLREPIERTPVWIMRQAGRYLPEYRAARAKAGSFMDLCRNPELACEVTMQPLRRFKLDAAILFSDILTVPDAMGLGLYFEQGEGPRFERPVRDRAAIEALPAPNIERDLGYVTDAVSLIRTRLEGQIPLIGFSGSPWTLATYMVEGGSSKDFRHIKAMAYRDPETLELLLSKITKAVIDYLNAQSAAGAQALMIFDTWGGALAHDAYQRFSLAFAKQVIAGLERNRDGRRVPVVFFTKGGGIWLESIADCGADGLGVDWTIPLNEARARTQGRVALQGNLDPNVLYAEPAVIEREVARVLTEYGHGSGHVFNLGHGIHPQIPPEHVEVMVNAVHNLSPQWHVPDQR